ncbi:hypothetical protein MSAN_00143600 [Mycena sanguinolenta]|uniref:Uncharacterized protein n=1 Tax=Mycena sanguinolenta TaxID=230812 RepID=A0A8H6ZGS3_9AGAR|nr:hypothetical protein MSAN_00143600 [Mycena sanguinolenta]
MTELQARPILALGGGPFAVQEWQVICGRYEIDTIPRAELTDRASVIKAIAAAVATRAAAGKPPYVALILFLGLSSFRPFNENVLGPLTKNGCRLICGGGTGYDFVDIDWLTSQGVLYCNTPTAFTVSTANGALMLILAVTRAASQSEMYVKAGKWRGDASLPAGVLPLGHDIEGMTLPKLDVFGCQVIYHSRRRVPESEENGARYVSMDELLAVSDVISVNCPLTPETRHLLGPAAFFKMKTGVFVVNTARGPIIDEDALVEALRSGKVSRVALDVFEREPIIHPGLLDPSLSHRVTFQPHMTGVTVQGCVKGELELLKSLEEFLEGGRPEYAVNLIDSSG